MAQLQAAARALIGFINLYLGWWACLLGVRYGYPWLGPALLPVWVGMHLLLSRSPTGEGIFFVSLAVIGFTVDTLLIQLGLFSISPATHIAPAWMISMWVLMGLTTESFMRLQRQWWLLCLMGGIWGPLYYVPGQPLKILTYREPFWLSLLAHGALWALLTPLLIKLRGRWMEREWRSALPAMAPPLSGVQRRTHQK